MLLPDDGGGWRAVEPEGPVGVDEGVREMDGGAVLVVEDEEGAAAVFLDAPGVCLRGVRTRCRASRFPKTTRASPTWESVPRIVTWRWSVLLVLGTVTRAPEMSAICLRPRP